MFCLILKLMFNIIASLNNLLLTLSKIIKTIINFKILCLDQFGKGI